MGARRLGKEKAEELEEKVPGCLLSTWLKKVFTHVTLEDRIYDHGTSVVVPKVCNELTIGLLSTDNVADWARIAYHLAPVGIIVDKIPLNDYRDYILLLRNDLTRKLLREPNDRTARRYLDILERRAADQWAPKSKGVSVKATADGGEGKDGENHKITFDFEIVQ